MSTHEVIARDGTIPSRENPLCGVADQQETVLPIPDQRVQQTESDLRNVLNFVDDDGGVAGVRPFFLQFEAVGYSDEVGGGPPGRHSRATDGRTDTLPAGRGDQARHPGGPDPREAVPIKKVRNIYIPDLHIDTLNVKARNFR
jgi:hypothetical protein